jgi:hypothetical protein
MACGRVDAIPVAVVAMASDAIGDDCTTIVAGSHADDAASVPIGRMDVTGVVSVGEDNTAGWVAVIESLRFPAPPVVKLSPGDVGVAVIPVSVITACEPADVGATIDVLLSDVVIPPPTPTALAVVVGALPGAEVIIIEAALEVPPVGTAEKLIPEVTGGWVGVELPNGGVGVGVVMGNVTESVAMDEIGPRSLLVGIAMDENGPRSLLVGTAMDENRPRSLLVGTETAMDENRPRSLLVGVELSGVVVVGAELSRAVVVGAELSRAVVVGAELSRAVVVGAELSKIGSPALTSLIIDDRGS